MSEDIVGEIREVMAVRGLTQDETAREIGVSMQTIWRWLNGSCKPQKYIVKHLEKWVKNSRKEG